MILSYDGKPIYRNRGPLHSLTLLLPQNEAGKPYELAANGRKPVRFNAGLQPITVGQPEEKVRPIRLQIPGAGPRIAVSNIGIPRIPQSAGMG